MELSEASLEELLDEIKQRFEDRGKPPTIVPTRVVWSPQQMCERLSRKYGTSVGFDGERFVIGALDPVRLTWKEAFAAVGVPPEIAAQAQPFEIAP